MKIIKTIYTLLFLAVFAPLAVFLIMAIATIPLGLYSGLEDFPESLFGLLIYLLFICAVFYSMYCAMKLSFDAIFNHVPLVIVSWKQHFGIILGCFLSIGLTIFGSYLAILPIVTMMLLYFILLLNQTKLPPETPLEL